MKKNQLLFSFCLIISMFNSCQKKQNVQMNSNGIKSIDNLLYSSKFDQQALFYKEFLNSNRLGSFTFNSYNSPAYIGSKPSNSIVAYFYNDAKRNEFINVGDKIWVNDIFVAEYNSTAESYRTKNDIENDLPLFFGTDVHIKINSNATTGKTNETTVDFYSPKTIDAGKSLSIGKINRTDNFTITWNADNLNPNGVAIVVDWTGNMQGENPNGTFGPYIVGKVTRNVDMAEDNGSYIFDANKMLKDIPKGAKININIYRGDYKIVNINGIDSRFDSYSQWNSDFINVMD